MKPRKFLAGFPFVLALVGFATTAWGLQVTLNSGAGPVVFDDSATTGIVDFDTTVGGVIVATGRAIQEASVVSLASPDPEGEAVFRNISGGPVTLTVTIQSSSFTAVGPPLGWAINYGGRTADSAAGPVNVSSHSVQMLANAGATPLGTLAGLPITTTDDFYLPLAGTNIADSAVDIRVVYTFTLEPDDEIYLPDNAYLGGNAIQARVFNQDVKCIDKIGNYTRRLFMAAHGSDSKCVTAGYQAGGSDETACVDDLVESNTNKAETKLIEGFAKDCEPSRPPWGVSGGKCCEGGANDGDACLDDTACLPSGACRPGACTSYAVEQSANDISHDLFGTSVLIAADAIGKCQKDVIKRAGMLLEKRWAFLRKCKKENFKTIEDDAEFVTTCLGPPQPDPRDTIARAITKIGGAIDGCLERGVTPGSVLPGLCTGESNDDIAECITSHANCRFCLAVNVADEVFPAMDCDMFDDLLLNLSCPP